MSVLQKNSGNLPIGELKVNGSIRNFLITICFLQKRLQYSSSNKKSSCWISDRGKATNQSSISVLMNSLIPLIMDSISCSFGRPFLR